MPDTTYIVTATNLNLRQEPGTESPVLGILPNGALVEVIEPSANIDWWHVRVGDTEGYVKRQYLLAKSTVPTLPPGIDINRVLWDETETYAGRIAYRLGEKRIASGAIDCSGWVEMITCEAFDRVNAAAAPHVVFPRSCYRVLDTHSDGIISGVQNHTGRVLKGTEITVQSVREGMLIGCNFGNYTWEQDTPPRVYGIDHIVQVVRDPATGTPYITQSSSSGKGVNRIVLADWLRQYNNLVISGRMYAVDPFAMADHASASILPQPKADTTRLARFSGRSVFAYALDGIIDRFGTTAACIAELQRCQISNVWLRIHGRGYEGDSKGGNIPAQKAFADALKAAGIGVAGWGWCQGDDPEADAALAARALRTFGLTDYMADIEEGVNGAEWTAAKITSFVSAFRIAQPNAPLCITSHGFIDWHHPEVFSQVAALGVDCLCPQTYWSDSFPSASMLRAVGATASQYALNDPSAYVRLCCDRWKRYGLPLIPAGQTCRDAETTQAEADDRLARFLANPPAAGTHPGVAFWHWATTSKGMRDGLAASPP